MPTLVVRSSMPVPQRELFAWHTRPGAFDRLVPPWRNLTVLERRGGIENGARLLFEIRKGWLRCTWDAAHTGYVEQEQFIDRMDRGPFARWTHTHRFLPGPGSHQSVLEDRVDFAPPLWPLTFPLRGIIRRELERVFAFRHARLRADLARPELKGMPPSLTVVSGSSGVIGSALVPVLTNAGHTVRRLVRRKAGEGEAFWQPGAGPRGGQIDPDAVEGADAVVHLAGENIAVGRWNEEKKARIRDSRVESTRLLSHALANAKTRPRVLIVASGTAIYGDRADEDLNEEASVGSGFLAEVARDWEAAAEPARQAGIRVVMLRIGIGLSTRGGLLAATRGPASLGLAAIPGGGRQWWSWIGIDDVVSAILHAVRTESVVGPVNVVAPGTVTAGEFISTLSTVLDRPVLARVPSWAFRAALGEKADVVLNSTKVMPEKLRATGFRFERPTLEQCLRWEMGMVDPAGAGVSFDWS